jgi:hypothetical protein
MSSFVRPLAITISALLLCGCLILLVPAAGAQREATPVPELLSGPESHGPAPARAPGNGITREKAKGIAARLPISFEPNQGQANIRYRYLAHQPALGMGFMADGVDFMVPASDSTPSQSSQRGTSSRKNSARGVLKIRFEGNNSNAVPGGEEPLAGKVNYLRGDDASRWQTNIATFGRVRYQSLYPETDLVFYGNGEEVEHDFVLNPGADPGRISLRVDGAKAIHLLPDSGDLLIDTGSAAVCFKKPVAYQSTSRGRVVVEASYLVRGSRVGFEVGNYDRSLPLVIDPVLTYSTFLAGSQQDGATGVAVDANGNVYVTGTTSSLDFPTTQSAYQSTNKGNGDIFVTKLDASGANAIFSTYIGGSGSDTSLGIGVDGNGNVILGGVTGSRDFPTLNSYATFNGFECAFLLSLSPAGDHLNYSSLLGQVFFAYPVRFAFTVDSAGAAYLTGQTNDLQFPITANTIGSTIHSYPFDNTFITKLDSTGAIKYSTVIPGTLPYTTYTFNGNNFQPKTIAIDASGSAYIAGQAGPGLPTTGGTISPGFPGDLSNQSLYFGFVMKIDPSASTISYATYLPYTAWVSGIALTQTGNAYAAGLVASPSFPVTPGAFQKTIPPGQFCTCGAGFVAELDSGAASYVAATFLTGTPSLSNGGTSIMSLGLDENGNPWLGGATGSADFPLKNPIVSSFPFGTQFVGFITEMKPDLSDVTFSTFISGSNGIFNHTPVLEAVPAKNGVVLGAGSTSDSDFPTTAGSFEPKLPPKTAFASSHAFVVKIDTSVASGSACFSTTSLDFGTWLVHTPSPALSITVKNCGNGDLHFQEPAITGDFSETNTCSGAALSAGASCQISVTFTPSDGNFETQTMTVTDDGPIGTQKVSLSGKGGIPVVELFGSVGYFGDQLVGTSGNAAPVVLFNDGDGDLIVSSATITGDFSVTKNTCAAHVPPQQFCYLGLKFSPQQPGPRNGVLTINDNAADSPQLVQLVGTGLTAYTVPIVSYVQAVPVSSGSVKLNIIGNNFFPASTVQWNGSDRPAVYLDETRMYATLSPSDVSSMTEVPVTVTNPAPGGGISDVAIATVFLKLSQSTADMVFDPHSNLLYATVPSLASANADSVIVIDPATGAILPTFALGNNPHHMAISDDGSLLYVGLDNTNEVVQLALPSGTVLGRAKLKADSFLGPTVAQVIKVLPGQPHSYAVSRAFVNVVPSAAGITIYDDQTPRTKTVDGFGGPKGVVGNSLLFLNDPSTLYASDEEVGDDFYRLSIDATGITLIDTKPGVGGGDLSTDGHLIYETNGRIVDPSTPKVVNTYVPTSALLPAAAENELYSLIAPFLPSFSLESVFTAADLESLGALGTIHFPLPGSAQNIARWGDHGFAFRSSGARNFQVSSSDAVALFTSSIAHPGSGPPASLQITLAPNASVLTAGFPLIDLAIAVVDSQGHRVTGYAGTVHFVSGDPSFSMPDYTFQSSDEGIHHFANLTLFRAGTSTVSITDVANSLNATLHFFVLPGFFAKWVVTPVNPGPLTAGVAAGFTVAGQDAYQNTVTDLFQTAYFSSSDPQASLPSPYAFKPADTGVHTFSIVLRRSGAQTITVSDNPTNPFVLTTIPVEVNPAAAGAFTVTAPANVTRTKPFQVRVVANDPFGNIATGYLGTVQFTSSDPNATLPGNYTFTAEDSGGHTFSVGLAAMGGQTVTVADASNNSITGSAQVNVLHLSATSRSLRVRTGQPFTLAVANFLDESDPDPATLSANIDWGDGTTQAGVISHDDSGYVVAGNHTYLAPPRHAITITISDTPNSYPPAAVTDSVRMWPKTESR